MLSFVGMKGNKWWAKATWQPSFPCSSSSHHFSFFFTHLHILTPNHITLEYNVYIGSRHERWLAQEN